MYAVCDTKRKMNKRDVISQITVSPSCGYASMSEHEEDVLLFAATCLHYIITCMGMKEGGSGGWDGLWLDNVQ